MLMFLANAEGGNDTVIDIGNYDNIPPPLGIKLPRILGGHT